MDTYPAGLTFPEKQEGVSTPTHGGMVAGPEYDVPITQKPVAAPSPDTEQQTTMERTERTERYAQPQARPSSTTQRPRPVSMPPQAYATTPNGDRDQRQEDTRPGRTEAGTSGKSRSGTRILGDYTLSKTLGAGSMGKVKLAHHNITGEKVSTLRSSSHAVWDRNIRDLPPSSRSKSSPAWPPAGPQRRPRPTRRRSRRPRMPRRR